MESKATGNDFVKIFSENLDLKALVKLVTDPKAGAISTFIGVTRDNWNGKKVLTLEYEAYEPMAEKEMLKICNTLRTKFNVFHIAIYHRTGLVPISEPSIIIAISSDHRVDGLEAVHWCIDEVKATVPIWKKEFYEDGSMWKGNVECKHGKKCGHDEKHKEEIIENKNATQEIEKKEIQTKTNNASFRIGLLTISDTRRESEDKSGAKMMEFISKNDLCTCIEKKIVIDSIYKIRESVSSWIASEEINVIISTGGTGLTGRDVTFEAVKPLLDKFVDGFGEIFRNLSYQELGASGLQSRVFSGIANGKLIFCLPGSTGACTLGWKLIEELLNPKAKGCSFGKLLLDGRLSEK
jgi:molybdenum cofactor biosynthesis protein B